MALRLPELIVIFVVALLIFGPKRLPEMGAQIGKALNSFRKGMSEFNHNPLEDLPDYHYFRTHRDEIKSFEARRLELEILEREIALRKSEASALEVDGQNVIAARSSLSKMLDEDDDFASKMIVDADVEVEKEETAAAPLKGTSSDVVAEKKDVGVAASQKGASSEVVAEKKEGEVASSQKSTSSDVFDEKKGGDGATFLKAND
jgi:sec-independent protein translocase protein TatA